MVPIRGGFPLLTPGPTYSKAELCAALHFTAAEWTWAIRELKEAVKEHGRPHFHALYGEFNAVFDIETMEAIEGDLPARAERLVREWAENYRAELLQMWKMQQFKQLPGLE